MIEFFVVVVVIFENLEFVVNLVRWMVYVKLFKFICKLCCVGLFLFFVIVDGGYVGNFGSYRG